MQTELVFVVVATLVFALVAFVAFASTMLEVGFETVNLVVPQAPLVVHDAIVFYEVWVGSHSNPYLEKRSQICSGLRSVPC